MSEGGTIEAINQTHATRRSIIKLVAGVWAVAVSLLLETNVTDNGGAWGTWPGFQSYIILLFQDVIKVSRHSVIMSND